MKDLVPNKALREAVQQSGLGINEIAVRCGWMRGDRPDSTRLRRTLGMMPSRNGLGKVTTNAQCKYETAVLIARAVGVDPHEVGV